MREPGQFAFIFQCTRYWSAYRITITRPVLAAARKNEVAWDTEDGSAMTCQLSTMRQRRREGQRYQWLDFNAGVERLRASSSIATRKPKFKPSILTLTEQRSRAGSAGLLRRRRASPASAAACAANANADSAGASASAAAAPAGQPSTHWRHAARHL